MRMFLLNGRNGDNMSKYLFLNITNEESYTISTKVYVEEYESFQDALNSMRSQYLLSDLTNMNNLVIDEKNEKAISRIESRRGVYNKELEKMLNVVYFDIDYLINLDKNKELLIEDDLVYFNNKFGTLDTKEYIGL